MMKLQFSKSGWTEEIFELNKFDLQLGLRTDHITLVFILK